MALWQFDVCLLSRSEIRERIGRIPEALSLTEFERWNCWLASLDIKDIEQRLSKFLVRGPSWDSDLRAWGAETSNRVDLWLNGLEIESILVRIDARDPCPGFLAGVAGLAAATDCVIRSTENGGEIFEPQPRLLFAKLRWSQAARYVDDPQTFLAREAELEDPEDTP